MGKAFNSDSAKKAKPLAKAAQKALQARYRAVGLADNVFAVRKDLLRSGKFKLVAGSAEEKCQEALDKALAQLAEHLKALVPVVEPAADAKSAASAEEDAPAVTKLAEEVRAAGKPFLALVDQMKQAGELQFKISMHVRDFPELLGDQATRDKIKAALAKAASASAAGTDKTKDEKKKEEEAGKAEEEKKTEEKLFDKSQEQLDIEALLAELKKVSIVEDDDDDDDEEDEDDHDDDDDEEEEEDAAEAEARRKQKEEEHKKKEAGKPKDVALDSAVVQAAVDKLVALTADFEKRVAAEVEAREQLLDKVMLRARDQEEMERFIQGYKVIEAPPKPLAGAAKKNKGVAVSKAPKVDPKYEEVHDDYETRLVVIMFTSKRSSSCQKIAPHVAALVKECEEKNAVKVGQAREKCVL